MTCDELKQRFPRASESFIRRNATPDLFSGDTGETAQLERDPGDGAVGKVQIQAATGARFLVRVTSRRKRLLDEDNLAEKYHVDLCRYAGVLPSDAAGKAKIEVCQEKTEAGAAEFVRIEIFKL